VVGAQHAAPLLAKSVPNRGVLLSLRTKLAVLLRKAGYAVSNSSDSSTTTGFVLSILNFPLTK
jgi:hypothetical protein